jgi:hypothetical protein
MWHRRRNFNPIASTVPKCRMFKLLRWMQNLHQSPWDYQILNADRSPRVNNFIKIIFAGNQTHEHGGRFIFKIHILFHGDNSWIVALKTNEVWFSERSWTCLQVLFESLFSSTKILNMAIVRNYEIILGQSLNHCI